jgi:peptidoglycan/LPS O-acetylase OafA/YrhL
MVLNIQMLRAFAAILVVLHHLGPHYQDAGGGFTALTELAKWGFFGVDIFFVISGFVISFTVFPKKRDIHSAGIYLRHRLSRIYLGYWPFALLAVFVLPLHSPDNLVNVSMLKTLTLTSGDLNRLALPVAWSLSFELYFYMIFGLLFCFSNKVIKRVLLAAFVLLLLRILLINLDSGSNWAFWLSAFMLEFFCGVLIFLYRDLLSQRRWMIPGLSIIAVGLWLGVSKQFQLEPDTRVLFFGISAASIVMLALQLEVNKMFIAPRWLVSLGDSSYALYLSHVLLITAFYTLGLRDLVALQPQVLRELSFLAFLVFMIVASHLYYRYIERPVYLKAISLTLPAPSWKR